MPRSARKRVSKLIHKSLRDFLSFRLFGLGLVIVGVLMMAAFGVHQLLRYRALKLNQQLLAQYQPQPSRLPEPTHIFIRWFIDVPVSMQVLNNEEWTIAQKEASYLAQSARPGENGNIIIYGHNTRENMGNIRALKGYETINLTTADGLVHQYKVVSLHQVSPTKTEFLQPTAEETLTLYTCAGFADAQRFVVVAKPIQAESGIKRVDSGSSPE